jgi:branched-chain amino acid transport system permease protein
VGLTMVFGVLRVINFAHGEYLMLAMFTSYFFVVGIGMPVYATIAVSAVIFFAFGILTYWLIFKPIINAPTIAQIFVTVGLGTVLQNLALIFFGPDFHGINTTIALKSFNFFGVSVSASRLVAFLAALVITMGLMVFMKHTYIGRAISAVSQDRNAAKIVGINLDFIYSLAFGIAIALVSVAAVCILPIYGVFPTVGVSFQLLAFVIVIIGGLGNIPGALIGGILIGVVEVLSGYFLSIAFKEAIYFIIFIVVLWIKPAGLFGKRGFEQVGTK